eukprot:942247-Prymnesium_polylepis.1
MEHDACPGGGVATRRRAAAAATCGLGRRRPRRNPHLDGDRPRADGRHRVHERPPHTGVVWR